MRDAGPSVDPPSEPFLSTRRKNRSSDDRSQGDAEAGAKKKRLPRGVSPLPPGVSPEVFEPPASGSLPGAGVPSGGVNRSTPLPPPAPEAQLWTVSSRRGADIGGEPSVVIAPEAPEEEPPSRLRTPLMIVGAFALLLLLAYAVPAMYMWGRVLPGTHVAGVRIGGMSETAAIDRVRQRFEGLERQPVPLVVDGRRVGVLDPQEAGLAFDVEATIASAQRGFPSPVAVVRALTSDREIPPLISVNTAKFASWLRGVAKDVDHPVREGAIVYTGTTPKVVPPRDGVALDQGAAAEVIKDAFLSRPPSITLPVVPVRARADTAAFNRRLTMAREAVAGPITLVNGARKVSLSPEVIAANLVFVSDTGGVVRPEFDAKTAVTGYESALVGSAQAARDAGFVIEGGTPRLVPARTGRGVDVKELCTAVSKAIAKGGDRTIPVALAITEPALRDEQAAKLGIKERISRYTSVFPCCAARVTNIQRAADLLDGHLVRPGETFSMNEVIGRPDKARGFVRAQLIDGDRLAIGMGGGVSQVVTTVYNAAFYAGMADLERVAHAFHVRRYPAGRDAVLSYPDHDMRFRNDSGYGVLIKAAYTDASVTIEMWSTKRYERVEPETSPKSGITQPRTVTDDSPGCLPMDGAPGFTVTVTRAFYQGGRVLRRDQPVITVYRPRDHVICGAPVTPDDEPPVSDDRSGVPPSLSPTGRDNSNGNGGRGRNGTPPGQDKDQKNGLPAGPNKQSTPQGQNKGKKKGQGGSR
ncbi:VanW family protein [Sphaerisporangium rubeum]|uniref:Vancomycin resistance protein YoaR n=1 Tax=Sphaerisporangium rubeum TaxID=321317 RepID=A0A7X0M913_9ACTN|nr:vancomycin resistance protein YoaR [Sphaerisporangium rubeum]